MSRAARTVARGSGQSTRLQARVLPGSKVDAIREIQKKYGNYVASGRQSMMPALKTGNVGIAFGPEPRLPIRAADGLGTWRKTDRCVELMHLSRATFSKNVART